MGYKTTKAQAQAGAAKLVKMLGKGWKPRVWENLGWHYNAVSLDGRLKVHPPRSRRDVYGAFLGRADSLGGWWAEHARTAKAAIRKVLQRALAEQAEVTACVESAQAVLKDLR